MEKLNGSGISWKSFAISFIITFLVTFLFKAGLLPDYDFIKRERVDLKQINQIKPLLHGRQSEFEIKKEGRILSSVYKKSGIKRIYIPSRRLES